MCGQKLPWSELTTFNHDALGVFVKTTVAQIVQLSPSTVALKKLCVESLLVRVGSLQ